MLPVIHHDHILRDVGDDAEIVRDDQHGHAELALEIDDLFEYLRLDGHVQRRRRLVGDQQRGPADQRHGDHRPLAQTAGQLERVGLHCAGRVGEANHPQHFARDLAALGSATGAVKMQRFGHLVANRVQRRQRGHRFLEDNGDASAAN